MTRLLVGAAVLGWVAHLALIPMEETDLFFHLKLGDVILETGSIPFRNLFSFTWPDHPDPDLAWGFQVAVALLYRAGGFPAVVLAKAALIVAAFGLAYRVARVRGASAAAAAAAVAVAAVAAEPRMCERPHLVTFVGIGALQLLLAHVDRGRTRLLLAVPPLAVLWANFHAAVFFAPLVLGLHLAGAALDRAGPPLRTGALVLAATAAAALASPGGLHLLSYLSWHTGVGATRNIEEFRVADGWNDPWFFALAAAAAATAAARALRREARLRELLPVAVVAVLAYRSVRFVAEWALLAAPLVAAGLDALAAALRVRLGRPVEAALALGLLGLVAAGRVGRSVELGLARDVVPFAAIRFVTEHGLRDRMFHDLDVGCYLLWEGWPRYRVFEDARLPAYPHEFHRAMDGTPLEPAAFDALLARHGVDAALLNYPDINRRAGSFDPAVWALVYREADALVFARRVPRHLATIARFEIPLRARFAFRGGTRFEPLERPPAGSPVEPCAWSRRLGDALESLGDPGRALDARVAALGCLDRARAVETRFLHGARLHRAGDLQGAIAEYDRALALDPAHASALANRGFARAATDPAAARRDLEAALALDPARADIRLGLERLR